MFGLVKALRVPRNKLARSTIGRVERPNRRLRLSSLVNDDGLVQLAIKAPLRGIEVDGLRMAR